jgi:hypothetical protein
VLKKCRIVVLVDREFHSPKLAKWLDEQGVYFALRQKKTFIFKKNMNKNIKLLKTKDLSQECRNFMRELNVVREMN